MKRWIAIFLAAATLEAQAPQVVPGVEWARIPAGSFQMGCVPADERCDADEHPRRSVTISRPFELMTTEVTKAMYLAFDVTMDDQPPWSLMPDQPVAIVTWTEAQKFCQVVGGRLPTEAEWEYAARGGRDGTIYPWGDELPDFLESAANGAAFESDSPRAVKTFPPNGYGLYETSGNVWEWVADWFGAYSTDAETDPQGPVRGLFRMVRGGSYGDDPGNLRVSNRNPNRPRNAHVNVGFRCARDF